MKIISVLTFIIPFCSFGQMMENEKGTILSDDPFNEKFIKSVKLKSISGKFNKKELVLLAIQVENKLFI